VLPGRPGSQGGLPLDLLFPLPYANEIKNGTPLRVDYSFCSWNQTVGYGAAEQPKQYNLSHWNL
jgi:hypothetical protein